MENNMSLSRRLRDQLHSLLGAYEVKSASRSQTFEDTFPQPVVGTVSVVAQLEDLLPILKRGARNILKNSVESKNVIATMRTQIGEGNGGLGKRLQVLGFVEGNVSDLESDSEYSDVDTRDLEITDSRLTDVNEILSVDQPGPSREPALWDHNVGETRAALAGNVGVKFYCETTRTAIANLETPPQYADSAGVKILTVPDGAHSREDSSELEVSTTELNVHRESGNDAVDKWESITEPIFGSFGTIGSSATWKDTRNKRELEKEVNLIDGKTATMAGGWQTARSSTVDTSLVDSEISSREIILSDVWAGSEGSLWKSATDPIYYHSSWDAMSSAAVADGSAIAIKEGNQRPSNEYLADNDGSLHETEDDVSANVVALCVEVAKEATLKQCSEEGDEMLIKDAKNKIDVRQMTESFDSASETGFLHESQGVSDGTGNKTKEPSTSPVTDDPGEEASPPPSPYFRSSDQSLPLTLKHVLETPGCSGNPVYFKPPGLDPKSDETVLSAFTTSPGSSESGGQDEECSKFPRSERIIQESQDRDNAANGTRQGRSSADNIAMMVFVPSVSSESTNEDGNQPTSSKINAQCSAGTVNDGENVSGMDDRYQATASKESDMTPIAGTVTSSRGGVERDQNLQKEHCDNPDTESVVPGAEDPGNTKSAVPTVSKSLEDVIYVFGPYKEPRYNLRKRPQPIRPSQSGPTMYSGCGERRKDGSRKKPRTSSPGMPLPAPFRVPDVSPVRSNRLIHPHVSSVNLVSSPNQGEWGNCGSRKRANEDEPVESDPEAPPSKKARTSNGNSSSVGAQSSSSRQLSSAGRSETPPSGLPERSAKTDGQQTEPVKIREIKKAGPETKVRARVTPQVAPPPVNRANRDRSQNTKPVIIEDRNGSKLKPKGRKPSDSDRRPKP